MVLAAGRVALWPWRVSWPQRSRARTFWTWVLWRGSWPRTQVGVGMGLVAWEAVSATDLVDGRGAGGGRRGSCGHGVLLVDEAYYL